LSSKCDVEQKTSATPAACIGKGGSSAAPVLGLRLEHFELASHERVALIFKIESIVWAEIADFAAMHHLPRPSMSNTVR
jgi:hypothetical protein